MKLCESAALYDRACCRCERLAAYLGDIREQYPTYHARPVPAFGAEDASLLIVGLAPGLHGANATGRPFTGDYAGILLYETLYANGFSNRRSSEHVDDGLELKACRITNAVKCLPPQNKPNGSEINTCNRFLRAELAQLPRPGVILALGRIAHTAVLKALELRQADFAFAHGALHRIDHEFCLLDSYHCSRYNTQTKRLDRDMFNRIFVTARELLESA